MSIKTIFCDLDGTLLKSFHKIDEDDMKALKRAQDQGIMVSVATGRLDYEIQMIMKDYGLKGYRVSQNGAVVYRHDGELVHINTLDTQYIEEILKALEKFNVLVFFQTEDQYLVEHKNKLITDFEQTQSYITYVEDKTIRQSYHNHQIVTISLWAEAGENHKIKKYLDTRLPKDIVAYVSSDYTLDITSAVNSKGNAIKAITTLDQLELQETAVIGDSYNDISMFEITPHSYVMDIAEEQVKTYATHIVTSVKQVINHILD